MPGKFVNIHRFVKAEKDPAEQLAEGWAGLGASIEDIKKFQDELPVIVKEKAEKTINLIVEVDTKHAQYAQYIENAKQWSTRIHSEAKILDKFLEAADSPAKIFFSHLFKDIVPKSKSLSDEIKEKIEEGVAVCLHVVHAGRSMMQVTRKFAITDPKVDWDSVNKQLDKFRSALDEAMDSGNATEQAFNTFSEILKKLSETTNPKITENMKTTSYLLGGIKDTPKIGKQDLDSWLARLMDRTEGKKTAAVGTSIEEHVDTETRQAVETAYLNVQSGMEEMLLGLTLASTTADEIVARLETLKEQTETLKDEAEELVKISSKKA